MMESIYFLIFLSAIRMSLPLFFSVIGGFFSERSGVAQIALESFLLIGAFSAASICYKTDSVFLAYLLAGTFTLLFSQIFCLLVLYFKANSIVIGTGMNLLAMGIIPIISKSLFNSTGSTPQLNISYFWDSQWPYLVLFSVILVSWYLEKYSLWGLQMKFAGEKKLALQSVGISALKRQWQSISLGAFITGLGGAVLSTSLASSYSPLMSSGRGFIALAALIFSGWNLIKALVVCLFFGLCEALQIYLQSQPNVTQYIAAEFIQMLPYFATLLVLLTFKSKVRPPAELQ